MATLAMARVYQHSFRAYPNCTLAAIGGCLSAVGDSVAQLTQIILSKDEDGEQQHRQFDMARTTRFFCYGLAMSPMIGRWNIFLERRFLSSNSSRISIKPLLKRVTVDQLVMAPIGLAIFTGSMGLLEGRSPKQIEQRFRDMFSSLLLANWKLWPLAQLVNFRYMPLPYRVPFSQTVGVFWTLYLSIVNSEEDRLQDRAAVALQKS